MLPDKIRIASGRRPVAMATGVIDRNYKQGQPQKQVLVVVTSGWSVMCFDHNLKKLWEENLQVRTILIWIPRVVSFFGIKKVLWQRSDSFVGLIGRKIFLIMSTIER